MITEYLLGEWQNNFICVLHPQLIPRMLPSSLCVLVSRLCRAGNKSSLKTALPALFSEGPSLSVYAERGGVGAFDMRCPPPLIVETECQGWERLWGAETLALHVPGLLRPPVPGLDSDSQFPRRVWKQDPQTSKRQAIYTSGCNWHEDLPGIGGRGDRSWVMSENWIPVGLDTWNQIQVEGKTIR